MPLWKVALSDQVVDSIVQPAFTSEGESLTRDNNRQDRSNFLNQPAAHWLIVAEPGHDLACDILQLLTIGFTPFLRFREVPSKLDVNGFFHAI